MEIIDRLAEITYEKPIEEPVVDIEIKPKIAGLTRPDYVKLWLEGKPVPRKFL